MCEPVYLSGSPYYVIFLPSDVQSIPFFPLFYIIVSFYWDTCNFMFYLDCNIILLFFIVVTSCNELNCRYQEKWFPFSWMICSLENMSSVDLVLFINLDFTFKICLSFDIFFFNAIYHVYLDYSLPRLKPVSQCNSGIFVI